MRKKYKLTQVYILCIDGIPHNQVFTSVKQAANHAGIDYQKILNNRLHAIDMDSRAIRIVKADIIRQHKGRKNFDMNKNIQ